MAVSNSRNVYYLETNSRSYNDKCIESPLPIALDVIANSKYSMKITEGEVFAIKTKVGYGFLQYVASGKLGIEIIRVLEPIKNTNSITQDDVNLEERYTVQFVVKAALKNKLIERTGLFKIPINYIVPTRARTEHKVRGEVLGWHIVDQVTLNRELKQNLSSKDILLPPHGIPNDTLLVEWLETNWRLADWK